MTNNGYSILVTGGAGFLGGLLSERLLSDDSCHRAAIFSRDWHKQKLLRERLGNPEKFRWFLGDIRDKDRLEISLIGIDYILHCAALKDIESGAYNPRELMLTNINGTQNVIESAINREIKKVLFVSTDKSAAATTAYGASKAMGEHLIVAANSYSPQKTRFACVRYGNVVGSSSSVVPLWREQSVRGVITITHPKMTRFLITPVVALDLIFNALERMTGGEIFVPKLNSTRITDLAKIVAPTSQHDVTGIRPGEKMHEIMLASEESLHTTDLGWAYCVHPTFHPWNKNYIADGEPVKEGWTYSSASATRMSDEELRSIL